MHIKKLNGNCCVFMTLFFLLFLFYSGSSFGKTSSKSKILQWRERNSLMLWNPVGIPLIEGVRLSQKVSQKTRSAYKNKVFFVALDPGHGGEDKGARGQNGHREKDIVLEIAQKTAKILKQYKNIIPVLIRKKDYFISIKHRCSIAHYNRADILVSIHANANDDERVRGTSVYFLSRGSASNRASKLIASRENASDLIEGFSYSESPLLDRMLVDLMQEYSLNESKLLGGIMLNSLLKKTGWKNLGLLNADFGVLKVPDIPSVLVETGFITNSEEEKLLAGDVYQNKIAEAISNAILQYTRRF